VLRLHKYTILGLLILLFTGCIEEETNSASEEETYLPNYFTISGNAQGTTYTMTYEDSLQRDFSSQVDSLLNDYDLHLSTYLDSSLISIFNAQTGDGIKSGISTFDFEFETCERGETSVFEDCFNIAREVYEFTDGAFNPTVFPLVKYWGFFKDEALLNQQSSQKIDSVLNLVDFSKESVFLTNDTLRNGYVILGCYPLVVKTKGAIQLDMNGIAQGHAVDVIADFFIANGITNFLIELGGEIRTSGVSYKNQAWRLGIDKPLESSEPGSEGIQLIVALQGQALATSGSYRKFYEKDGIKYSHTIDPFTGYPVQHNLISVSVIAPTCAEADAYATAFMVMGTEKAIAFIEDHPELNLHAYFVEDEKGKWLLKESEGFANYVIE
jgi:FAD:protein FMN transferase